MLRDWFEASPANTLHISYCPSHVGVRENESVDLLVGQTSNSTRRGVALREPIPESISWSRANSAQNMTAEWNKEAQAKGHNAYFGREYPRHKAFCTLAHKGARILIKQVGRSATLTARTIRCLTGHAPKIGRAHV